MGKGVTWEIKMNSNSINAYYEERENLSRRCKQVLQAVENLGKATDRTIKSYLGFEDMNAVRPRVTELIKAGQLEEAGQTKDTITNKKVRLVKLRQATPQMELF
jgi:hypothetical protein